MGSECKIELISGIGWPVCTRLAVWFTGIIFNSSLMKAKDIFIALTGVMK